MLLLENGHAGSAKRVLEVMPFNATTVLNGFTKSAVV
jgi:hypothetical protein